MSITYKAKKKKRQRKHGFLKRMQTSYGRDVISRRRRKKRARTTI
ncbi:MAG: 50S ribosomal protein L34 [Candidatus Paceibacterota bacterium]